MSNVVLEPKMLSGLVAVPPSKSAAHRAVICAALAQGVSVMEPVIITDAESINKSYPSFFEDYNNLGGNANVINMG